MSIAELKQTAAKLTPRERAWLRAYLFAEERASDPAWKTEMAARRKRLKSGRGISDSTYASPSRRASARAKTK